MMYWTLNISNSSQPGQSDQSTTEYNVFDLNFSIKYATLNTSFSPKEGKSFTITPGNRREPALMYLTAVASSPHHSFTSFVSHLQSYFLSSLQPAAIVFCFSFKTQNGMFVL